MAGGITALDEAIREYLFFRGFVNTLKQFETEKKEDRDKELNVSKYLITTINRTGKFSNRQTRLLITCCSVWSGLTLLNSEHTGLIYMTNFLVDLIMTANRLHTNLRQVYCDFT